MKGLIAFLALAAGSAGVPAAGFDCARATTTVEHTICATPALSALDDRLATLYDARKRNDATVVKAQREWLHGTRDKCATAQCLAQAYDARIHELESRPIACAVSAKLLSGHWDNVEPSGDFDELYFGPEADASNFVSWQNHAPYITGKWSFSECKLHIAGTGEGTNFDYAVEPEAGGKLRLTEVSAGDVLLLKKTKTH